MAFVRLPGISNQHAEGWLHLAGSDQFIGLMSLFDRKSVSDEGLEIEFSVRKKPKEGFHISGFGPAYITYGIVTTFLLVGRIVAARPVRSRQAEIEFFFIIE